MSPEQAHEAWARLLGREPLTGERLAAAERVAARLAPQLDALAPHASHPSTQAAEWDRYDAARERR